MARRRLVRDLVANGELSIDDGYRAKLAELGQGGPIFLRAGALQDDGFSWEGNERFELGHAPVAKRGRPNDVVITTKGNSTGRVGIIPDDAPEFVYSPHLSRWRVEGNALHAGFLYYWVRSSEFTCQVRQLAFGTDMAPYLSLTDQLRIVVPTPDRTTQIGIAEVLASLDEKISTNRSLTERCAGLARAHWAYAARVEVPLSDMARFVNGRAFTKGASGTGRVVIRIAELNSGLGSSTVYNDIEVADDHLARPGDLLFAWSGSLTVARWFRPEAIVNQHIFKVIPRDGYAMWLVDQAVRAKLADYRAIAADKATTMGHIQRAHLDHPVAIPEPAEIERIGPLMQSLWDRALAAEVETLQLEKTRDELLPLLMSGRVQVRDLPDDLTEVTG